MLQDAQCIRVQVLPSGTRTLYGEGQVIGAIVWTCPVRAPNLKCYAPLEFQCM